MDEKIGGDELRGHLESMVLSVLERSEAHGFEVWRRLEIAADGALKLKEGSLYPALYRLEKDGLVKARWESEKTERRGPRRRTYSLTSKGKKHLQKGREAWLRFVAVIGPIVTGATA
jgi:DNA-binding PadR family transcriptional regulator